MTVYVRVNGVYTAIDRPFVRVGGSYIGAKGVWVRKTDGTGTSYRQAFLWDVTPPKPPEVALQLVENRNSKNVLIGRYLKVGTRLTSAANDPSARLIRVLSNYAGAAPTSFNGPTFTQSPDADWKGEPWSEWRYNDYGPHNDSSILGFKQWPLNATATADHLTDDKIYYFTAWALDNHGNWSVPTPAQIKVPKATKDGSNVIVKEARFQANTAGSWTSVGFQSGKLIQSDNPQPRSRGLWMYGNQLSDAIGQQGTPTIRSAQIYIKREQVDSGQPVANMHLAWTPYATVGDLPQAGSGITQNDMKKVGTLAKGTGDWFDLPASFYGDLDKNIKGMSLNYKDYLFAASTPADYSVVQQLADNIRCGELHVIWQEAPGT